MGFLENGEIFIWHKDKEVVKYVAGFNKLVNNYQTGNYTDALPFNANKTKNTIKTAYFPRLKIDYRIRTLHLPPPR